jgi:hypothetical protein
MKYRGIVVLAVCLGIAAIALGAGGPKAKAPASAPAPAPESGDVYARLVRAYMDGDLEQVETELRSSAKEIARLAPPQQADVAYLRQAMAECRPPWWKGCKAGQKTIFQASVWGRPLNVIYEPSAKDGVGLKAAPGDRQATLSWNAAEMDSTQPAEYGYLKGDLNGLGVWSSLGMAAVWSALTPQMLSGLTEKDKLRLNLYLDFRGNVTGLCYGSPPARRWGLHIFLAAYLEKYGKGPMAASRRAVASMFLVEVLKDPSRYPSVKLPGALAAESAEEKLAADLKFKMTRKTAWTLAEEKAFREAVKAFAAANDLSVFQTAKVALPNGLGFALLAEEDGPFRAKRDAWVKAQFDKAAGR